MLQAIDNQRLIIMLHGQKGQAQELPSPEKTKLQKDEVSFTHILKQNRPRQRRFWKLFISRGPIAQVDRAVVS